MILRNQYIQVNTTFWCYAYKRSKALLQIIFKEGITVHIYFTQNGVIFINHSQKLDSESGVNT